MHKTPSGKTPFKFPNLKIIIFVVAVVSLICSFISLARTYMSLLLLLLLLVSCWLTLQLPFIKNKEKLTLFLLHQNDISVILY
jgi:hypothetical protein